MSADRDPETLALFIEETSEALQRVDQQLVDAERGTLPDSLMASLFRDIHTMKGSAGFLDFSKTASLAHVTEDLLAKLRDGAIVATATHFALLMKSVDVLRQFLDSIKATGEEAAIDTSALAQELRAALNTGNQSSSPVSATPAPAPTADPSPLRSDAEQSSVSEHAAAPARSESISRDNGLTDVPAPPKGEDSRDTKESGKAKSEQTDSTVRVNVGLLDNLMNLIGELVLARNQMVQIVRNSRDASGNALAACQRLNLVTSDLQEQVMKTRMQPIARVFEKIPRMVRDLCNQVGKHVNPVIDGNATELDKALVEAIRDPVLHIIRNAIDHGIEFAEERIRAGKSAVGKLIVRAAHEGGAVTIEIKDDGKGMDPNKLKSHAISKGILTATQAERLSDREALDLVFKPGFSTAAKVTDISGRGVGMDVVRTHVERAGGLVELDSIVGKGTTIRLKMPLTLAIIPALLVGTGKQRFAIPQVNLLELVYLNDQIATSAIEHIRGSYIYRLRGEVLPLVFLDKVLNVTSSMSGGMHIVVVAVGSKRYGMVVDEVFETEEIVIKPLSGALKRIPAYSGATVLGDGGVALILEVAGIATMTGIDVAARAAVDPVTLKSRRSHDEHSQPHVIFSTGEHGRCAVPLSMVSRLEQVARHTIEIAGGAEVLQYRNVIMPVVRAERVIAMGNSVTSSDTQALIVFDFGHMVAMGVNQIIDVIDVDRADVQDDNETPFVQGRVVVLGQTTLLLDVYGIVRQLAPQFVRDRRQVIHRPRILLADSSNAMRAATSTYLSSAGAHVVEANSLALATQMLGTKDNGFDALITDLDFSDGSGVDLVAVARERLPSLPCWIWSMQEGASTLDAATLAGARGCIHKMSRETLVAELERAGVLKSRRAIDGTEPPRTDSANRSAA